MSISVDDFLRHRLLLARHQMRPYAVTRLSSCLPCRNQLAIMDPDHSGPDHGKARSNVQEFIDLVTSQLGVGEAESKSATSGIMDFIKEQLDDSSFSDLIGKLPGAEEFMAEQQSAAASPDAGGGLLGSLTSMAGSLMGGKGAGIAGVVAAIAASGISVDKAGGFLTMLINFIKEKLGNDGFSELAAKIPDLLEGGND